MQKSAPLAVFNVAMETETQCPLKIVTQLVIQFCVQTDIQMTNFVTNVPQVKYQGYELSWLNSCSVFVWLLGRGIPTVLFIREVASPTKLL